MFSSLFDYVKLSAASVTTRIISGLAVAVPFAIASSFGLAAVFIAISNRYDTLTAAVALAVVFSVIGIAVAIGMTVWSKRQEALRQEALTQTRRSAVSALMVANPALLLGAGRVAFRLVRRAPLLIVVPLAAGFIFAMTRSSSKQRDDVAV